ncbi:MAG: UDP-N-acetylmuramoyl-L-alanyl-D-glutamate--2,6-diaminopimelate ligase [Flavobacteriaceae bacterium]|nr:UDP-N-acetylmuramoyl-L-alanyl-D-glutamate--2,6-diaminopimelate ligase [Flavobacteriaceae bacterium]
MKVLRDILYKVSLESIKGDTGIRIRTLCLDSNKTTDASAFIAIKGSVTDGHRYIEDAIKKGAVAIICENIPANLHPEVTYVEVTNSQLALAEMAANFYEHPSDKIRVIGVTGTNGKTTFATLCYNLFKNAGFKVGLLSTIVVKIEDVEISATHTTPDSIHIQQYLSQMADAGVDYCFMEVSSHGIHQKRAHGIQFFGGVFTNITHDHLDYHKTFADYRDVKKSFFDLLPPSAFALTNIDDKNGQFMLQNTRAKKYTYALKTHADFKTSVLENTFEGLVLKIDQQEIYTKLIGRFNAYNLTAIYATAILSGIEKTEALRLLSQLETARGRFQFFSTEKRVKAIIDYAHTPDALENILETINEIRTGNEQLITVVGCGGNRDKQKRPVMGHVAAKLSNQVIFTSDNPRNEEPELIIQDIEKGVAPQDYKKTLSITDRYQAIKAACNMAKPDDIILIAGKGHETYQEIKGVRTDFDDLKIAKEILTQLNH